MPIYAQSEKEKEQVITLKKLKEKRDKDIETQANNMLPAMKQCIIEFLGRNNFWGGSNIGKAFNCTEIAEGLNLNLNIEHCAQHFDDAVKSESFYKAIKYYYNINTSPDGIIVADRGDGWFNAYFNKKY